MLTDQKTTGYQFDGLAKLLARQRTGVPHRPPVVVASVFQTGLNLMRDLEEKGLAAIGIDCDATNPGFRSRFGIAFHCPNPDKEPADWLDFMRALSIEVGEKPVLIAAADIYVAAMGRHAKALSDYFVFSEAGSILQATLTTKEKQYALAREYGLPSPRSAYIESLEELEKFSKDARFPILLKPRSHREWQALPSSHPLHGTKTVSSKTIEELKENYGKVQSLVPQAVLQEEIVGPDSAKYCYLSVYGCDRSRLGSCVVQELRAYPLLYGCATLVEPVVDEEIDTVCDNFLKSIGFIGICEIELKRDSRDGKLLLVEVNPRFSGTGDCARYTGVEVGYIHYLDLIGKTPEPTSVSRLGFRHVMLVNDFTAFPIYLSQRQITWAEWFRSLKGPIEYFDFDRRDPRNARRAASRAGKALVGGLLRRWRLRK